MDVQLRDVKESDLPIFFEHQRDPVAVRMAAFVPRDREAFMTHWKNRVLADKASAKRTIVCDGSVVGYLVSFERSGKREVGYWVGREHWGKGIATQALLRFLGQVDERPLYALVAVHNIASIRVLEKCGFAIEDRTEGSPGGRGPAVEEYVMRLDARPE